MTMERRKTATFCSINLVVYIVALGLFLAGYAGNYWAVGEFGRYGLFETCSYNVTADEWTCERFGTSLGAQPSWFIAVFACMTVALILTVVGGLTAMFLPVTAAFQIAAGVFSIAAVATFGHFNKDTGLSFGWAYALAVAGGSLFFINGHLLAVLACMDGCSREKLLPGPKGGASRVEDNVVQMEQKD